jgi:hypothetical protein
MGAPKEKRKTHVEKNKAKAVTDDRNPFVRLSKTPEGRALMAEWRARSFQNVNGKGGPGRRPGSKDGYTQTELNKQRAKAKAEAIEIVKIMEKKLEIPKDEFAREALTTAVEIMRIDAINAKDKLAAARTVLEWTMAKPSSSSEVTIKSAESFLDEIASEIGK